MKTIIIIILILSVLFTFGLFIYLLLISKKAGNVPDDSEEKRHIKELHEIEENIRKQRELVTEGIGREDHSSSSYTCHTSSQYQDNPSFAGQFGSGIELERQRLERQRMIDDTNMMMQMQMQNQMMLDDQQRMVQMQNQQTMNNTFNNMF